MSLRRVFPKNRNANSEADQRSLENDRAPTSYTSNVTIAPAHTLSGSDFVTPPDETKSLHTDTVGVAGTSEIATNYGTGTGKRPSGKFQVLPPLYICVNFC